MLSEREILDAKIDILMETEYKPLKPVMEESRSKISDLLYTMSELGYFNDVSVDYDFAVKVWLAIMVAVGMDAEELKDYTL